MPSMISREKSDTRPTPWRMTAGTNNKTIFNNSDYNNSLSNTKTTGFKLSHRFNNKVNTQIQGYQLDAVGGP